MYMVYVFCFLIMQRAWLSNDTRGTGKKKKKMICKYMKDIKQRRKGISSVIKGPTNRRQGKFTAYTRKMDQTLEVFRINSRYSLIWNLRQWIWP